MCRVVFVATTGKCSSVPNGRFGNNMSAGGRSSGFGRHNINKSTFLGGRIGAADNHEDWWTAHRPFCRPMISVRRR